jgi:hypothetical protein
MINWTDHRWLWLVNGYPDRQHPVHVDDAGQHQDTDNGRPPRFAIGSTYRHHPEEGSLFDVRQNDGDDSICRVLCEGRTPLAFLNRVLPEPG